MGPSCRTDQASPGLSVEVGGRVGVGLPRAPWALRLLGSGLPAPLLQPQWLMPGPGVPASLTDGAIWLLFLVMAGPQLLLKSLRHLSSGCHARGVSLFSMGGSRRPLKRQ